MRREFCDFCTKEIKNNRDNRHFRITQWNSKEDKYQEVTHHGDYHVKCVREILKVALIHIPEGDKG